jgi:hypothetical protein
MDLQAVEWGGEMEGWAGFILLRRRTGGGLV